MDEIANQAAPAAAADDVARIVDESAIGTVVPLSYPVSYQGRIWDRITVRHPSARDFREFERRIDDARRRGESADAMSLPMTDAPQAVLDVLRLDDEDRVIEAMQPFLPRRFRATPASESGPSNGVSSPST